MTRTPPETTTRNTLVRHIIRPTGAVHPSRQKIMIECAAAVAGDNWDDNWDDHYCIIFGWPAVMGGDDGGVNG